MTDIIAEGSVLISAAFTSLRTKRGARVFFRSAFTELRPPGPGSGPATSCPPAHQSPTHAGFYNSICGFKLWTRECSRDQIRHFLLLYSIGKFYGRYFRILFSAEYQAPYTITNAIIHAFCHAGLNLLYFLCAIVATILSLLPRYITRSQNLLAVSEMS